VSAATVNQKTGFPLCWPEGRNRTPSAQRRNAKFKTSFWVARDNLIAEIRRLGGSELIISSNIPRQNDGLPYADARLAGNDPGLAVYFTRKGKQLCFACDQYLTVDDNMQAVALTIEALRGIARWGTGDMMERAFTGFAALPERASGENPWEVLGVAINATEEQVTAAFRTLAKRFHPDNQETGSAEAFDRIRRAHDLIMQAVRKPT
jgi:DnaJ domain